MAVPAAVYRLRYPQATDYYRCIGDHLESFIQGYEEKFERTYGFFRPYLRNVMYQYLDCGNLRNRFARVKCKDCNYEYLLAFSCKRRHFCLSCHQKRVVEFGEKNPIPGPVIAIQVFGDLLGFNTHCHILTTDRCFYRPLAFQRLQHGKGGTDDLRPDPIAGQHSDVQENFPGTHVDLPLPAGWPGQWCQSRRRS